MRIWGYTYPGNKKVQSDDVYRSLVQLVVLLSYYFISAISLTNWTSTIIYKMIKSILHLYFILFYFFIHLYICL